MSHTHLTRLAQQLPEAWKSTVVARFGAVHLKVLRMDGSPYPAESHAYAEGLLVIDGRLNLTIDGAEIVVGAGELFVVPVGVSHSVASGSTGTLAILDLG